MLSSSTLSNEKMETREIYSTTSFNITHDVALTAEGMEQSVDDRTLFCTPAPLAASTIARDAIRMRQMTVPDIKGSFLNEVSQLSSQSDSLNLSQELMRPNFNITADANILPQAKPQMFSGSNLIHFSGVAGKDEGTVTPDERSDSLTDVSSRSSMGLIPNELLSDLSSSMLPLNTPKGAPPAKLGKPNFGSVLSPSREIVGDSTEWSDSSKQDSKDLPMGRSHLMDTVKKKPQFLAEPAAKVTGHGQRALAFIAEGLLDNVDEGSELDLSVCDVEFAAEELQQLDEEFSDICEDKDSDDDEISNDEPFLGLPIKSREKKQETDDLVMTLNNGTDSRTKDVDMDSIIQMQGGDSQAETTSHEENRLGEGQESDKDEKGNQQIAGMSKSGLALDACYFHKTPIPFPGDGEDIEVTSLRNSHNLISQRGAAEGENLLGKLRRQFMSADGSEIDTEDELEAVREELALSARQRVQGADTEDNDRSDLPQPVGLENDAEFAIRAGNSYRLNEHQHAQQFSFLVRQSAEGHTALSPVPGGEGDGSSGSESNDGNDTRHRKRKNENHVVTSGFPVSQATPVSRLPHLDITYRDKLEEESGLQAMFFMPTTAKLHSHDTEVTMNLALEGSSFHVEDILRHSDTSASASFGQKGDEPCPEASGANKQDMPLEDQFGAMESSFGSFGLEHAVDQESLLTAGNKRLDDLNAQIQPSVPEMNKTNSTEDPFKRPLAPPLKKKEKVAVTTACKNRDEWTETHLSSSGILGKTTDYDLKHQLLELGIDIGEENFQTADSAKAKLAADEEQFEHDNKFSEHHRLCQAAGQTWDGNETTLSGYLGEDDKPEHMEMSISSYMATRTEALGRLDGGDGVPRPEFGNPVYSPPRQAIPVKLMSPPSACSTVTLYSRTEGEGNEDGDRTLTNEKDLIFSSAPQSQSRVKKIPDDHEIVQRDMSSLLLDLTHGNTTDLTMEDALSISSVMNFVKQHNFSSSSNFAQAVLKFSSMKKQQVGEGQSRKQTSVLKGNSKQSGGLRGTESAGCSDSKREGIVNQSMVSSETRVLGTKSSTSPHGTVTPTSPKDILSPLKENTGKGSRLPIRPGSSLIRVTEKRERSVLHQDLGDQSSKMPTPRGSLQQVLQSQLATAPPDVTAPQNLIPTQLPYKYEMSINKQKDDYARSVQASLKKGCLLGDGQDQAGQITAEEAAKAKQSPAACVGKKVSGQSQNGSMSAASPCETDFHSGTESNLANVNSQSETESFGMPPRKHAFHVSFEPVVRMQVESDNLRLDKTSARNNDVTYELPLNVPANVQKDGNSRERISIKATQERTHSAGDSYNNVFSDKNTTIYRSDVKQKPERTRLSETTSFGRTLMCSGSISRDLLQKSVQHDHHVPDGRENSAPASKPDLDPGMCRKEAVGVEDLSLMDFRHFEVVSEGQGGGDREEHVKAGLGTIKQTGSVSFPDRRSLASFQKNEQSVTEKPILLTGSSLLKTEFAQQHLSYRPLTRHVSIEPQDQHFGQQPSQPFPSCQPTGSAVVLPTNTVKPLEEPNTTVYYELNEDFQQTTVPESSVMASFWGKSPLYQSTPAFEMGRTAATSLMTSKLNEQDLTAGGTNMVTPRVQRLLVNVQRTVIFRDFCCLGVSEKTWFPITNKSAYGLVCRLQVLQVVHNNRASKLDVYSPFELKSKIFIAPEASEEIPVLFVPKCPGEHVAHVEVLAQSLNPAFEPTSTIIQLRATAEAPSIQISPSVEVLEFGEVIWGTCQTRSIKLRNLKHASLPVRLSIWSSSVWHCFTFDNSASSSDISIISLSNRPETLGRNILTVLVPGRENEGEGKVVEISFYCRPPSKEKNRALAERPAEKIEAKVLVEVDTPVQYLPALSTLTLQAVIGMPHLLIPPTHMSLMFKTAPERTIQETICLNNAGNISMELAVGVTTFPDCFQVKPRHVAIKPQSKADVVVTFSPLEKGVSKYQSLLLLDIEPEGPSYELPMEAHVEQPVRIQRTSPSVLSSSSFLSFNGVALNQTKSLTLRLLNNDSQRTEHVLLEIRGATDCFKLVIPTGEWQQKSELVISPKQKKFVTVMFCPSAVRGYLSKLLIRIRDSGSSKYSIPLAGYGGRSVLTLSGACLTNYSQRWLELGPLSVGHNIMQDIVLTNSGVRAAFVKASAFYDMACREPVIPGGVAVEPNNIVLAPGSSVKVMVAISPSERERDMVKERKEMIAVVRFQHGDEVMRQKYQKLLAHGGKDDVNSWQASFAQQFANESQESITKEGCTIPDSPDDGPAFLHHLSAQIVALLAEPHPERDVLMEPVHVPHLQRLPKPSSGSAGRTESVVSRDTLKQYDPSGQFLIPNKPSDVDTEWTVKPDFLTLTVGESNQKMLQLLNFSRSNLRFELMWPSNSVVPEPQKGEVKPRSSVSIEVWLHMAWQKRTAELPWQGDLTVTCSGKQKIIKVYIKNAAPKPLLSVASPTSRESMSMVSKLLPADANLSASSQSLQLTSTNISFPCARVNELLESDIELTNISSDPLHWKVQAFAPAYVKGADENNTVQRVGYSVFQIIPISGDLLPHESLKVPIKFCPKTRGTYNQHWEIEYQPLVGGKSVPVVTTKKIFITAEASSTENPMTAKQILGKGSLEKKPHQRAPLQEKQHNTMPSGGKHHQSTVQDLLLLNPEVMFCDTVVGKVTQVKVEFKNIYETNIQLETQAPKPPFFVKHLHFGITKKRFLKYPVEFRPSAPGDFEDTVVFRAPQLNKTFAVHLMGRGKEEKSSP